MTFYFNSVCFRHKILIGVSNHALRRNKNAIELEILNQFIHPNYDGVTSYYDVAILETASLVFSTAIRPVCLPEIPSEDIHKYDNDYVELIGWGQKYLHGPVSNQLKKVALKIHTLRFV